MDDEKRRRTGVDPSRLASLSLRGFSQVLPRRRGFGRRPGASLPTSFQSPLHRIHLPGQIPATAEGSMLDRSSNIAAFRPGASTRSAGTRGGDFLPAVAEQSFIPS